MGSHTVTCGHIGSYRVISKVRVRLAALPSPSLGNAHPSPLTLALTLALALPLAQALAVALAGRVAQPVPRHVLGMLTSPSPSVRSARNAARPPPRVAPKAKSPIRPDVISTVRSGRRGLSLAYGRWACSPVTSKIRAPGSMSASVPPMAAAE